MRVVWLSPQAMSPEQTADLAVTVGLSLCDPMLDIVQRDEPLPVQSHLAVRRLREIAEEEKIFDARVGSKGIFAGALPAHIAARVVRHSYGGVRLPRFYVPVSVHASAAKGGFVHSHWEAL